MDRHVQLLILHLLLDADEVVGNCAAFSSALGKVVEFLSAADSVVRYGCQLAATIRCWDGSFAELTIEPAPRPLDAAEYIAMA